MAIICRKHKLLFIMVPGTGCSVVGKALQEQLGGTFLPEQPLRRNGHTVVSRKHNTVPELTEHGLLSEEERRDYLIFASVRNPFDRWVTYYQRYEGDWLDYYEGVSRRQIERDRETLDLSDEEVERRRKQHERRFRKLRRRQQIIGALGFNVWMTGTLIRWALDSEKGTRGDISRYAFPMLDGVDLAIRQERLNDGLNRVLEIAEVDCRINLPKKNETSGKKTYTEYYSWTTRKIGEILLGQQMDKFGYEFNEVSEEDPIVKINREKLLLERVEK